MSARRVSILGSDGSGTTTLMSQLAGLRAKLGISVMFCPNFHRLEKLPFAMESRRGTELSLLADEIGSPRLKYLALFVRMKLFGPGGLDVWPSRARERLRMARALAMHEDLRSLSALGSSNLGKLSQLETLVIRLSIEDHAPAEVLDQVLAARGVRAP